jgi:DNA-binding NarL/FixJ family response regulator
MSLAEESNNVEIWTEYRPQSGRIIRIAVIDDHHVVRQGLRALLELESDLRIVADVGQLDLAVQAIRAQPPDLVICDLSMPGYTGAAAVRYLRREFPTLPVLVMSAHDSIECIRESFEAGAIGYVRKDSSRADLLLAVHRAAAGTHAACPGVIDSVVSVWLRQVGHADSGTAAKLAVELQPEDRQVLRLIALGIPTRRIAEELGRGVKVVEKYRKNLMRRLELHSTADVARFAIRCQLLSPLEVDQVVLAE